MSDFVIGLVVLFFVYRIFRAILEALGVIKTATARKQAKFAPTPPEPVAPVYRSPRDTTARPALRGSGSVPRAVLRKMSTMAQPASQPPRSQSSSPFIIDRPRRFPLLGILAVAATIVLISSCYAWINEPSHRPAPGRNAERALHLQDTMIAALRAISPVD